ncbi:MAG: acetylglutamate kinase [Candidatus Omnitrophota bacterium]
MREQIFKTISESKYLSEFKDKFFVIKYGGSLLDDEAVSDSILEDIMFLHQKGIKPVLVHGGGSMISKLMKERGKSPSFDNGHRITDKETAFIVDEALTNVNKALVEKILLKGGNAQSLVSSRDKVVVSEKRANSSSEDFVGSVKRIDTAIIEDCFSKGRFPVISPVGIGDDGQAYNINADVAACEIASALRAEKLMLLTNVKGVMKDKDEESSLITSITEEQMKTMISDGLIHGGMIPKVESGIAALGKGVKKVHIISGRIEQALFLEIFTDEGIGTEIVISR